MRDLKAKALEFQLAADSIDADRYLPPPAKEKSKGGGAAQNINDTKLPVDMLDAFNVNGVLKTDDLAANDPPFNLLGQGQADLDGGKIDFTAKPQMTEKVKNKFNKKFGDVFGGSKDQQQNQDQPPPRQNP